MRIIYSLKVTDINASIEKLEGNGIGMSKIYENTFNGDLLVLQNKDLKDFGSKSIKNITLGFMFTLMTFDFLYLPYILPSIGAVLLYTGFRDLRRANKEINLAWKFSIINMIYQVLNLIYWNTPLNVNVRGIGILVFISTVFHLSFLIIFSSGIKNIFNQNQIILEKDPILRIIIWRIVVIILAVTELGQIWFIAMPIIIYYFYIFRCLYKLSYVFEKINCIHSTENKMLSNKKILFGYMLFCALIVVVCCLFSNHINLDSNEVVSVKEFGIRNTLIDKGIPREIVKDIEDDDIANLKDIVNIETFSEELLFNSSSENKLKVTSIFIELKYNKMFAIEYFNWGEGGPYWQDGFEVTNTWPLELINGKLLYDKDGINYCAKIPRLSGGMVTSIDIFGDERQEEKITGAINYPYKSQKQRGYIMYKIVIPEGTITGANLVNYMHYNHPFRIPYVEVEKKSLMFSDKLRQHYTNFSTKLSSELSGN